MYNIIITMNKVEIIKNFNTILSDFLQQVSPLVGNTYYTKLKLILKVNNTYPIQRFSKYALQHEEQIINKNPEYFMNETTYKEEIVKNYGENSDIYMDKILHFKEIYINVDEDSQENLWSIIQALLLLAKEYVNH